MNNFIQIPNKISKVLNKYNLNILNILIIAFLVYHSFNAELMNAKPINPQEALILIGLLYYVDFKFNTSKMQRDLQTSILNAKLENLERKIENLAEKSNKI